MRRGGRADAPATCLECDCRLYLRAVPGRNHLLLEVTREQLYAGFTSAIGLGTMTPDIQQQAFQVFSKVSDDRFLVIAPSG